MSSALSDTVSTTQSPAFPARPESPGITGVARTRAEIERDERRDK